MLDHPKPRALLYPQVVASWVRAERALQNHPQLLFPIRFLEHEAPIDFGEGRKICIPGREDDRQRW